MSHCVAIFDWERQGTYVINNEVKFASNLMFILQAESEFGDKISRRSCGDCDVESSPTLCAPK